MSILTSVTPTDTEEVRERVRRFQEADSRIRQEVRKVIVGQDGVVENVLIALFVGGHCLLTGLPGTAKTLLVRTLARTLGLKFNRIQFTPDLMPSDITGTDIIEEDHDYGTSLMDFRAWADFLEHAAGGRDQSHAAEDAIRVAGGDARAIVHGTRPFLPIDAPFFVLATQNPIELEGTYPLPEAQLDRFLFNAVLDYLPAEDELKVVDLTTTTQRAEADTVTSGDEIRGFQQLVRMTPVAESVARYAVELVRATRPNGNGGAPDFVKKYVNFGASVRAAQFLVLAGKARALMHGRFHVAYEDVRTLAAPILRHRVLLNFHAESDRVTTDEIVRRLLEWKTAPRE